MLTTLVGACSASGTPPQERQTLREEDTDEVTELQAYIWANLENRQYANVETDSAKGYLTFEFQTAMAAILEHGVHEGLISPPACGGLEMERRDPLDMIASIHVTPQSITVETISECEEAEQVPVSEDFDGVTDVWWEDGVTDEYGVLCERYAEDGGEGDLPSGMRMSCATVEEYDKSKTVSYPSRDVVTPPPWVMEGERECEAYGEMVCAIVDVKLWPADPATGETEFFEVDCEETPWFCELTIDMVDPRILVGADEDDDVEPDPPNTPMDEECESIVNDHNDGGACTAEVAACSLEASCSSEEPGGWTECTHDPAADTTTCTQCYEAKDDGSCGYFEVTTTDTAKDPDDSNPKGTDVETAKGAFERHTSKRGGRKTLGGEHAGPPKDFSQDWKPTDGNDCQIQVNDSTEGDDWHRYGGTCK